MQAVATEHHANAMAMSNQSTRYGHPLDTALADRNMLSWFGPMFELLGRHWLVALAAGLVTLMLQWVMSKLPWPNPILAPWYVTAFRALLGSSLAAVITVVAYRAIAHREGTRYRVGDVNSPLDAAVRAVQITVVWVIAGLLVELALYLIVRLIISAATSGGPPSQTTIYLAIYFTIYGLPIAIFLLSPIWVLIGVRGAQPRRRVGGRAQFAAARVRCEVARGLAGVSVRRDHRARNLSRDQVQVPACRALQPVGPEHADRRIRGCGHRDDLRHRASLRSGAGSRSRT
jgi:hypothetical protein